MSGRVPLASREHALNLYKQLLTLSKRLPTAQQRDDAVQGVKESFRASVEVTDPSKASKEMYSRDSGLSCELFVTSCWPGHLKLASGYSAKILYFISRRFNFRPWGQMLGLSCVEGAAKQQLNTATTAHTAPQHACPRFHVT